MRLWHILSTKDTAVNRTSKNPCPCRACLLVRDKEKRQYEKVKSTVSSMVFEGIEKNKAGNRDRKCWVALIYIR